MNFYECCDLTEKVYLEYVCSSTIQKAGFPINECIEMAILIFFGRPNINILTSKIYFIFCQKYKDTCPSGTSIA